MEKSEARAYGMIARLIIDRINEGGGRVTELEQTRAQEMPGAYVAKLYGKAIQLHALSEEDHVILTGLFSKISTAGTDRVGAMLEAQYLLGFYQFETDTMSADEASKVLGVTKQRIYALVDNDQLVGYKMKNKLRIGRQSVERRKGEMDKE